MVRKQKMAYKKPSIRVIYADVLCPLCGSIGDIIDEEGAKKRESIWSDGNDSSEELWN